MKHQKRFEHTWQIGKSFDIALGIVDHIVLDFDSTQVLERHGEKDTEAGLVHVYEAANCALSLRLLLLLLRSKSFLLKSRMTLNSLLYHNCHFDNETTIAWR